jgi:site-specific DNA-methyltransferase (adenine-specific)
MAVIIKNCTLHNVDCMEYMKSLPDNAFDLAIVDPPYGIGAGGKTYGKRKEKHEKKDWDLEIPKQSYFDELMRVSKKQIIWGGNYFPLPLTGGWIFWDKERGKETTFSDGELAWTNFMNTLKKVSVRYDGFIGMDLERIHPTQKPVKLYETILTNYAEQGNKILDTHLGSGSHAIACNNLGFEMVGCELDEDYFKAACERIKRDAQQERLF